MNCSPLEKLFECIGEIDDLFLMEAEEFDISTAKSTKRKKIIKYGKYGAAGIAVSVGMIMAYRLLRSKSA
ncbi:MAG: hypothetical protein FWE29_04030 [Defluviitaleaceae bacterium]|nr:hypothetical protein [Defluviitaleaceae bacterium]